MKDLAKKSAARVTSAFGASLCPINRIANKFGLRERVCCVAVLVVGAAVMRLLLAK